VKYRVKPKKRLKMLYIGIFQI